MRENAGKFFFNPRVHDDGEKIVLGHKIPAGGGTKDGLMVLDILAHHPSTAKFIATKLVRHFVSDNPPPALVDRVAQAFLKSNGDIRETLARSSSRRSSIRPRLIAPRSSDRLSWRSARCARWAPKQMAARHLHQWIARMGEPLYGFQTPNGYSDMAENWVNTGALCSSG